MAITTDTTTLPGHTILTDSVTGGIAVVRNAPEDSTSYEYTIVNEIADKLDIIATRLESIHNALGTDSTTISGALASSSQWLEILAEMARGPGIKTVDPLAWMGLSSVYKLYAEKEDGTLDPDKLAELKAYKAKIDALIASLE